MMLSASAYEYNFTLKELKILPVQIKFNWLDVTMDKRPQKCYETN